MVARATINDAILAASGVAGDIGGLPARREGVSRWRLTSKVLVPMLIFALVTAVVRTEE